MKNPWVCSLALILALFMQNERLGEAMGSVRDMRGQPIVGASVVYTNPSNHQTYSTRTDAFGKFLIIGMIPGIYDVRITRPSGRQIYFGRKPVYAVDQQAANVIDVDLSLIPSKESLVPFLGVKAEELQNESWRNVREALPLFNLCATLFDMGKFPAAADACDRAIDADPKLPDPYYVKAAALAGQAAKNGRLKSSNQTAATLEKYLQLAPDGFYANDARALLQQISGR